LSAGRAAAASLAAEEGYAPAAALPQRLLHFVLFITVLTSSLAFIEPSPHDGLMLVLLVMCVAARVPFDRKLAPLLVLLTVWLVGGCLALIQVGDRSRRSSTSARRSICASRRSCSRACLAAAIRRGFRFCAAATSSRR
jgi:hypothetical protein